MIISWKAKTFAYAAVSLLIMTICGSAQAACPVKGKWFVTMLGSNGGGAFSGTCTIRINVIGNYTGTCITTGVGASPETSTASGTIKSNALCKVSGTMSSPGVADTTIDSGMVVNNSTQIFLAGHRGDPAAQVRMVILNRIGD